MSEKLTRETVQKVREEIDFCCGANEDEMRETADYALRADDALREIEERDFHPQECMSWIRGKACDCITSIARAHRLAAGREE